MERDEANSYREEEALRYLIAGSRDDRYFIEVPRLSI